MDLDHGKRPNKGSRHTTATAGTAKKRNKSRLRDESRLRDDPAALARRGPMRKAEGGKVGVADAKTKRADKSKRNSDKELAKAAKSSSKDDKISKKHDDEETGGRKRRRHGGEEAGGGRRPPTPQELRLTPRRLVLPELSKDGPITIGSDCAGLLSEGLALDMLGVAHKHVFAAECNTAIRHLLYKTFGTRAMAYYKDLTQRDNAAAPRVHLYVFGSPCQSWSPLGKRKGDQDARGQVLYSCLDYVKHKRPLVVLAENSAALANSTPRQAPPGLGPVYQGACGAGGRGARAWGGGGGQVCQRARHHCRPLGVLEIPSALDGA